MGLPSYLSFEAKRVYCKYHIHVVDLVAVLLSAAKDNLSPLYGTRVLKVFNKLFQLGKRVTRCFVIDNPIQPLANARKIITDCRLSANHNRVECESEIGVIITDCRLSANHNLVKSRKRRYRL